MVNKTAAMYLPKPKNQLQEVLFTLINSNLPMDFGDLYAATRCVNTGQRIARLRRLGLEVKCTRKKVINKHGNHCIYGNWSVYEEKAKAIELYKELTSKNEKK